MLVPIPLLVSFGYYGVCVFLYLCYLDAVTYSVFSLSGNALCCDGFCVFVPSLFWSDVFFVHFLFIFRYLYIVMVCVGYIFLVFVIVH